MGSAASLVAALPDRISKDELMQAMGTDFNDHRFQLLKGSDDKVDKQMLLRVMQCKYDVFLTHNWAQDNSNHVRVGKINDALKARGIRTWFDEEKLHGNIIDQMCEGISQSYCVVVFITQTYMDKVGGANDTDNCKLEFGYASRTKGASLMIPVVLEAGVRNTSSWSGQVGMVLGGSLYVDMVNQTEDNVNLLVQKIVTCMQHSAVTKASNPSTATEVKNATVIPPVSGPTKPLNTLTVSDVGYLLDNLNLSKYKPAFVTNEVTGMLLCSCEAVDDIKELGITTAPHARLFFSHVQQYVASGVPLEKLAPGKEPVAASVPAVAAAAAAEPVAVTAKPVKESPKVKFPSSITMSGLPFAHTGWNGDYHKTNKTSHGYPVYRNPPHMLLFVQIIGATIEYNGDEWILHRECDAPGKAMYIGPSTPLPTGSWGGDVYVS